MKRILLTLMITSFLGTAYADQMNPCEYMNLNAEAARKLDVGNDENYQRIVQQNNREIVRACQEYQISKLREQKANVGDGGQYYNGSWHPYNEQVN